MSNKPNITLFKNKEKEKLISTAKVEIASLAEEIDIALQRLNYLNNPKPVQHYFTPKNEPYSIIKLRYYPLRSRREQREYLHHFIETHIEIEDIYLQHIKYEHNPAGQPTITPNSDI